MARQSGAPALRVLLDTHIWIWSHGDSSRISRRVARILASPDTETWISPITFSEMIILSRRGRLTLLPDVQSWIQSAREAAPFHDAPLTGEVALSAAHITLPHGDPADWLLAATARAFDLTLITSDRYLLDGKGFLTLANRGEN
ncbi:MAG: type II toxin-antitoxin system VapC family toxin [Acidobacteriota bacterium]|nr:type II toxin-antitoxin system VapC family toxin [Acidobacteriota bacterium]